MVIGAIVKSNSHIAYLCRVYGKLETEDVPQPGQYAFGTFVVLEPVPESNHRLVGVIRDTILLNPDFGNLGPRLSSPDDLAVISPDYLNEKGVLVEILVLGWLDGVQCHHGVPPLAAQVGTRVETLPFEAVCDFHRGPRGSFLAAYLPQLVTRNDPVIAGLLISILERLEPAFPRQQGVISVLKNNLAWKAHVIPAG